MADFSFHSRIAESDPDFQGKWMRNLAIGSSGADVAALQAQLNIITKANISAGPPPPPLVTDGIFGAKTDAAVRIFQRDHNLNPPDGVVGPKTRAALSDTLKQLGHAALAQDILNGVLPPELRQAPARFPPIAGAWQITNVSAITVGEIGLVGGIKIEIKRPDNTKFNMLCAGAGFGVSVDPSIALKAMKDLAVPIANLVRSVLVMAGKSFGFSLGDYLQALGVNLPSVTNGRIISNPLFGPVVNEAMITGGGNQVIRVISAGAGNVLAAAESGVVLFGIRKTLAAIQVPMLADAIGIYGSAALVSLKVGAGVQFMNYTLMRIEKG